MALPRSHAGTGIEGLADSPGRLTVEPSVTTNEHPLPLESVNSTAELSRRRSRQPNYETESRALVTLAQELATSPRNVLQKLADTALDLCRAHSAGLSILEEENGQRIFRWRAIAGRWSRYLWGTMPRETSPCGTVLDRNATLLFSHPERHFPIPPAITPAIEEVLLIPFYLAGEAVGTIWVMAHDESRKFDAEDKRLMTSLGSFASSAYQVLVSLEALETQVGERKQAEEALRASERRLLEIIEVLPAAVYTTDAQGRITMFNRAAVEFSGRVPELGSDSWCISWKLYQPDGTPMPHDQCPMAIALKEKRPIRGCEAIAERPDGTRLDFIPYPTLFYDESGQVTSAVNMLVDITERKRGEEARARLAAIVESSDDAIISKDLHGIIRSWNSAAERLFGYTAQEAIGQPITMLIPADHTNEEPFILERIRRGERIEHYETIRRRKDGALVNISLTVSPIIDAVGRIVGASKIARDITQQKLTAEELRRNNEALRLANADLEQFAYTACCRSSENVVF